MPWIDVKLYDTRVTEESVPKIIEGFTANGFGPISKTFEGIACYKVIQSAVIHNCSRFTV